jgi:hypothetical protein
VAVLAVLEVWAEAEAADTDTADILVVQAVSGEDWAVCAYCTCGAFLHDISVQVQKNLTCR